LARLPTVSQLQTVSYDIQVSALYGTNPLVFFMCIAGCSHLHSAMSITRYSFCAQEL